MTTAGQPKRKLIEVSLPLEAINRESAREKFIRHGHPSTLHLWWSRKPLAAARAMIFAQLVDDPSAHPDEFPTEEAQRAERERLHRLIERLVVWENTRDEKLLAEAHAEILKSTNGNPPPILDPFAGGGSIPLEAQRLGLEAHASDLNPVAVLINKALIEIPPKFRNRPPIFPGLAESEIRDWQGAEGLAADVRAYSAWMREEAEASIGDLYPEAVLPDGGTAPVIAWVWARTVTCPNPACGIEMPLVSKWWLGKKKGKEAYIVPRVVPDASHPSGRRVAFSIAHDVASAPADRAGTVTRDGALCVACQSRVSFDYIRGEGLARRIDTTLMALVVKGIRNRFYLAPTAEHRKAANVSLPDHLPAGELPDKALGFRVQGYGYTKWTDLFTNRQLVALATFSDLVSRARERVLEDALASGYPLGDPLDETESILGARAYADAVATYLAITVSRFTNYANSFCRWRPDAGKEQVGDLFAQPTLPMVWDFCEGMPFSSSAGGWQVNTQFLPKLIEGLPLRGNGEAHHEDARDLRNRCVISTDPPYYDNIGYSDLSDFFYIWLRQTLKDVHPSLFSTLLVPKVDELVASAERYGDMDQAKAVFQEGFRDVFLRARQVTHPDYPITLYYAFKQSDASDEGTTSTGWESLLEGVIQSGWAVTATWPVRSQLGNRQRSQNSNALESSIVLSLRPRPEGAQTTDRRDFIRTLVAELPAALRKLQQGQIAPVDLPQAAIGPGMAVFSRYGGVLEPDGHKMTVRSALARINEILDQVLDEQEGDFDTTTRFAIPWYRQHGYGIGRFGDADNIARARNTSVYTLDRDGILTSRAGNVQLIKPADLSWDYDVRTDPHISTWEVLHHLIKVLERDGIGPVGDFLQAALARADAAVDADQVKELAHLLFRIADGNGATKDALSINALVTSWPEILEVARTPSKRVDQQATFDFTEEGI